MTTMIPILETFLANIADQLELDTPSYRFDWTSLPTDKISHANRMTLVKAIASRTKAVIENGKSV